MAKRAWRIAGNVSALIGGMWGAYMVVVTAKELSKNGLVGVTEKYVCPRCEPDKIAFCSTCAAVVMFDE